MNELRKSKGTFLGDVLKSGSLSLAECRQTEKVMFEDGLVIKQKTDKTNADGGIRQSKATVQAK